MINRATAFNAVLGKMKAHEEMNKRAHESYIAIWKMAHEDGMKKKEIAKSLLEDAHAAGLTELQIYGLGLTYSRIRQIVEGPNPE